MARPDGEMQGGEMQAGARRPVLDVRDLRVAINGLPVVDGVSFEVGEGEILALVGESGCGKSITSLGVMGLLPGAAKKVGGTVSLEGRRIDDISHAARRKLMGSRMAMIFQEPIASLNPLIKVGPQIAETLIVHASERGRHRSRADIRKATLEIMERVGIPDPGQRYGQYPFELSGGMCQRIMIAMAIISRPALLLADEPTTALDVTIQAQILELVKLLRDEVRTSVLFVTHDLGVVADVADRMVVMYAGRVVEAGTLREVFYRPRHPYTRSLLETMRALESGGPKMPLRTIEGTVPSPREWSAACRFAPRCGHAVEICTTKAPQLAAEAGSAHLAACWRDRELAAW